MKKLIVGLVAAAAAALLSAGSVEAKRGEALESFLKTLPEVVSKRELNEKLQALPDSVREKVQSEAAEASFDLQIRALFRIPSEERQEAATERAPKPKAKYPSIFIARWNSKSYLDSDGDTWDGVAWDGGNMPLIERLSNGMIKTAIQGEGGGIEFRYFRASDMSTDWRRTDWAESNGKYDVEPSVPGMCPGPPPEAIDWAERKQKAKWAAEKAAQEEADRLWRLGGRVTEGVLSLWYDPSWRDGHINVYKVVSPDGNSLSDGQVYDFEVDVTIILLDGKIACPEDLRPLDYHPGPTGTRVRISATGGDGSWRDPCKFIEVRTLGQ